MRYEIAAHAEGSDHLGGVRIRALTAKEALQRVDEMAGRGMREIKITDPNGRRYGPGAFRAAMRLYLSPLPKSLDPQDIQIAVSAYESLLQRLNGATDNSTRETAARSIVQSMFTGERDPARLRENALAHVAGSVPSLGKAT